MKKTLSLLLVLLMLFSFCGVSALADDGMDICGEYTLFNVIDEENGDSTEMLQAMAAMGKTATLTVNEDGSAVMDLFGEEQTMTFDFEEEVIRVGENAVPYSFDGEVLIIGEDDGSFYFSKEGITLDESGGPFTFYILSDILDDDGESVLDEYYDPEDAESVTLILFSHGDAVFEDDDQWTELFFDFEEQTVTWDEDDVFSFELEEGCLIIVNGDGDRIVMEQADPGYAGPYVMTAMVSEEDGDITEQLSLLDALGMLPTMVVNEDGKALLDLFGTELEIRFDFEDMTAEKDGESLPFSYEYGVITIGEGQDSMSFSRVLEKEAE